MKITYYLEVISSWCYWAEPAWTELKQCYAGRAEFEWKIALMPARRIHNRRNMRLVLPPQRHYHARAVHARLRLVRARNQQYLVPNLVAEAAKDFGVTDDRVRLAIAHAGLREGRKVGRWEIAVEAAANACGLDAPALLKRAQSPEVTARVRASSAEFELLQINQRPAFRLENSIGDRAVFSGIVRQSQLPQRSKPC